MTIARNTGEANFIESTITMPHFIIIIGPPAVGKMTVGQELAKRTGFRLFANHLLVDTLQSVFGPESPSYKILVREFRRRIFEEAIQSNLPGVIFTCITAFNRETCIERLFEWINLWKNHGATVQVVELQATLEERLKRNATANRLHHKPSKRNLELSRELLLKNEEEWVMEAPDGIFHGLNLNYLKLDTTHMPSDEVVNRIMSMVPIDAYHVETESLL